MYYILDGLPIRVYPKEALLTKKHHHLVRMCLSEGGPISDFYVDHYTTRQRRDISASLNRTMWDEISLLRTAIKQFYGASSKAKDPKQTLRMAVELQNIGLATTRLAQVMQVNAALISNGKSDSLAALNEALDNVLTELESGEERALL